MRGAALTCELAERVVMKRVAFGELPQSQNVVAVFLCVRILPRSLTLARVYVLSTQPITIDADVAQTVRINAIIPGFRAADWTMYVFSGCALADAIMGMAAFRKFRNIEISETLRRRPVGPHVGRQHHG